MKLHSDKDAFEGIILDIENREGIRSDVLEKDYYVTLMLYELSKRQDEWKAYFKGGTALYKALCSINRFSEDIDLTVYVDDCPSTNQKRIRLERAAEGYTSLFKIEDDKENIKSKGSITTIYGYEPVFNQLLDDPLQRFGRVKVEATSFTVSEPTERMLIAPVLYDKATAEQKNILKEQFDVFSFEIITIKLERIFVDKVFAAEFYYRRFKDYSLEDEKRKSAAFDVAKHVYDLMILFQNSKIKSLLSDEQVLNQIIRFKRKEEEVRAGGIENSYKIKKFSYLNKIFVDAEFSAVYEKMQDIYIFNDKDKRPLKNAGNVFEAIRAINE